MIENDAESLIAVCNDGVGSYDAIPGVIFMKISLFDLFERAVLVRCDLCADSLLSLTSLVQCYANAFTRSTKILCLECRLMSDCD